MAATAMPINIVIGLTSNAQIDFVKGSDVAAHLDTIFSSLIHATFNWVKADSKPLFDLYQQTSHSIIVIIS